VQSTNYSGIIQSIIQSRNDIVIFARSYWFARSNRLKWALPTLVRST